MKLSFAEPLTSLAIQFIDNWLDLKDEQEFEELILCCLRSLYSRSKAQKVPSTEMRTKYELKVDWNLCKPLRIDKAGDEYKSYKTNYNAIFKQRLKEEQMNEKLKEFEKQIGGNDYLFKIVIIGNAGVGKSALLLRFSDDEFYESYLTTLGVDFKFKSMQQDNKNVKLQIWDTAGQERFRTITNAYYKGANGIIIVYDITSRSSFEDIEKYWLTEAQTYTESGINIILIANKADLNQDRKVSVEEAQQYAESKNMVFREVSAKSAKGVQDAFEQLSQNMILSAEDQKSRIKQSDRHLHIKSKGQRKCC